jgi:hypothetical protein
LEFNIRFAKAYARLYPSFRPEAFALDVYFQAFDSKFGIILLKVHKKIKMSSEDVLATFAISKRLEIFLIAARKEQTD